jgi:hypothetical protein
LSQEVHEIGAVEGQQGGVLGRDGGGGTGLAVKQGHLADEIAAAQDYEDEFVAVFGHLRDADAAGLDDVEGVAVVTLIEDDVAAFVGFVAHHSGQASTAGGLQALEEW